MFGFEATPAFAVLSIVFGIVCCFWGYRFFKVVLGILGFIGGAYLAGLVAAHFTGGVGLVAVIAAIAGGLIGAAIVSALYIFAVFVAGALAGWIFGMMLVGAVGRPLHYVLLIVLAVAGGLVAVSFQRLLIILSTSFTGSWAVVSGLLFFAGSGFTPVHIIRDPGLMLRIRGGASRLVILFWLAVAVAGIIFQLRQGRGRRRAPGAACTPDD